MTLIIEKNVSLAELTTLKIGGAAKFFARAETENHIGEALSFAEANDLQIFILGGGSNVLIADAGFDGLVLQIAVKGISVAKSGNKFKVTANAGEDWDAFCAFAVGENLQGVECLSGIPGFVGGTPVQNVGAYGQEVSETICRVRAFDRSEKKFVELSNADCQFAYRASLFNSSGKNRFVVSAVTFALNKDATPKIFYRDLREKFGERVPDLPEIRHAVLQIRAAKSMVINENDPNSRSAGSFFKNPIVSRAQFSEIEKLASEQGIQSVPCFKYDRQNVKIPAAWLIENGGFGKGFKLGSVGISTNHSLALINRGGATAGEMITLKNEIQARIKEIFDIELQLEPIFVGF